MSVRPDDLLGSLELREDLPKDAVITSLTARAELLQREVAHYKGLAQKLQDKLNELQSGPSTFHLTCACGKVVSIRSCDRFRCNCGRVLDIQWFAERNDYAARG